MKLPIFLYDDGDVSIFQSIEVAERYIESPDVLDNSYVVYDANGMRLELIAKKSSNLKLFGIEFIKPNKVSIKERFNDDINENLIIILREILTKQKVPDNIISKASLSELVDKAVEVLGYTS